MDVPDSSDYWQDIKHSLEAAGVPSEHMCAMSAVTGQGVIDLVKLVHTALDQLPAEVTSMRMRIPLLIYWPNAAWWGPPLSVGFGWWMCNRLCQHTSWAAAGNNTWSHVFLLFGLQMSTDIDCTMHFSLRLHGSVTFVHVALFGMHTNLTAGTVWLQEIATTAAVNQTELPKRHSEARIDEFSIDFELESGQRVYTVTGEAIERFAQMTNWDYYEAANRFQKVLEAAGDLKAAAA